MLSPGKIHEQVPRDLEQNLRWRVKVLTAARDDPKLQRSLRAACAQDVLFYINTFCWQFNPDEDQGRKIGPFITYPFQEGVIERTYTRLFAPKRFMRSDKLWEKSRTLGATWMALFMWDQRARFWEWQELLCMSHNEKAVYNGAADKGTLFWKLDFIDRHLPDWLRGPRRHAKAMVIEYPDTNSTIKGTTTTERSGVGDRATVLLDEFSKHQAASDILGQTADTGPRLFIGTHYGTSGEFYHLTQREDMSKEVMHWSQHPVFGAGAYRYNPQTGGVEVFDKTYAYPPDFKFVMDGTPTGGPFPGVRSPWYDRECRRRKNSRDVAMHLDINPSGSMSQFFDALLVRDLRARTRKAEWEGELDYDPRGDLTDSPLKRAKGGRLLLWLSPTPNGRVPKGLYKIAADVSAGQGETNSCLSVLNARTGEKIGEWAACDVRPYQLAPLAVALARLFADEAGGPAQLGWEDAGPGQQFGDVVMELGFGNVYWHSTEHELKNKQRSRPGWPASPQTKRALLEEYREAIYTGGYVNPSDIALEETLNFRYAQNGWVEHVKEVDVQDPTDARINHGDRVIADALTWLLAKGKQAKSPTKDVQEVPEYSLAWKRAQEAARSREGRYGWQQRGALV